MIINRIQEKDVQSNYFTYESPNKNCIQRREWLASDCYSYHLPKSQFIFDVISVFKELQKSCLLMLSFPLLPVFVPREQSNHRDNRNHHTDQYHQKHICNIASTGGTWSSNRFYKCNSILNMSTKTIKNFKTPIQTFLGGLSMFRLYVPQLSRG